MTEGLQPSRRISAQYSAELEKIRADMLEMGGTVERQLGLVAEALNLQEGRAAQEAMNLENEVNRMEVAIDEQCVRILVLRQPAARDLRLIMAIVKLTTDLERMGDEANKIARLAMDLALLADTSRAVSIQLASFANRVSHALRQSLDSFARHDAGKAIDIILSDENFDRDYKVETGKLVRAMRQDNENMEVYLNWLWVLRSFERIADHASNIAEQVVYLDRGIDVRHLDAQGLEALRKLPVA